ncbi:hypothetical protein HK104_001643, partial [Borealophlyctis nickersoniae]
EGSPEAQVVPEIIQAPFFEGAEGVEQTREGDGVDGPAVMDVLSAVQGGVARTEPQHRRVTRPREDSPSTDRAAMRRRTGYYTWQSPNLSRGQGEPDARATERREQAAAQPPRDRPTRHSPQVPDTEDGDDVPMAERDVEADRSATFLYNATLVKGFMTSPSAAAASEELLTRADQLTHLLTCLSQCADIKIQAYRYGALAFWAGLYQLELDLLPAAFAHLEYAIRKDTWLNPDKLFRYIHGYGAPQARRRHKFQYDAELFMFVVSFRMNLRSSVERFVADANCHTGGWEYDDVLTLIGKTREELKVLNKGFMRLDRNFGAMAPGHSEFLALGECYQIIFATAKLDFTLTQKQHVLKATNLEETKRAQILQSCDDEIKELTHKIAAHRKQLDRAIDVTRSWSPRMVTESREFRIAMSCLERVAKWNLAVGKNGELKDRWASFVWEKVCSNDGCTRVFNFGGEVRVAMYPDESAALFDGNVEDVFWREGLGLRQWNDELDEPLQICKGCGYARYCSDDCESEHLNSHSNFCAMIERRRQLAKEAFGK